MQGWKLFTFALIQRRDLEDACQLTYDSQFVVTRKARYFLVAHNQTCTPKEVNTILSREREAAELADQSPDLGGPREEEPAESDFFENENVGDESDDHAAGSFWIHAHPLASKKAAELLIAIQTIVGQVNNEFQGDVTRKIRLGAVSRHHGDSALEISGGKVREWARTKGFKVTSTAGGDPSNNSRAERCVGILKRMGENDASRQSAEKQ